MYYLAEYFKYVGRENSSKNSASIGFRLIQVGDKKEARFSFLPQSH